VNVRVDNPDNNLKNITDPNILEQISLVEDVVNPNLVDSGKVDGVVSCYSISAIIKELNSTASHSGTYDIPDSRVTIDRHIAYNISKKQLEELVADTNGDAIWDTAKIVIGILKDSDSKDIRNVANNVIEESISDDENADIRMDVKKATYLPGGTYTVFLKVQDNNGNWSEEVSTTIKIKSRDSDDLPGFNAPLLALMMMITMLIYKRRIYSLFSRSA